MKIQHVFFDLDHTLWDFEKNSELTFQKLFLMYKIEADLVSFLEVYKRLNKEYWKLYRDEKVTKEELRYGRLKRAFDAVNYTVSDAIINSLAIDYINFLPDFNHLFKGTLELLDYLNAKYTLHIITNGFEEIQSKKMKTSLIYHYFNKIITAESVGVKKPNPKVFLHALNVANATKETSIMIGDSFEADIEGALTIGMKAIHCNFENVEVPKSNCITVTSLLEIKQHL